MTEQTEKETTLYLVTKDKMMRCTVPVQAPYPYPEPEPGDAPQTSASSSEAPPAANVEQHAELVRGITQAYHDCEARLRSLCEGDENSVLFRADAELQQLIDKKTAKLPFLRSSVLATEEGGIQYGQWRPLAMYDLANENVKQHYSAKFVADFKSMKPNKTGLRLLVLETSVAVDGITVRLMFFAFFMLEYRCVAQMAAFDKKFGSDNALPTASLLDNVGEVNQMAQPPNSVRIVNIAYDFLIMHKLEKSEAKAKESLDKLAAKSSKLDEAMIVYKLKREQVRHRALFHNASTLIAFMLRHFATTIVERYEQAKPQFPDRMMVHINVETAGTTINLDETHCMTLTAVTKLIETNVDVLAKLEAEVKPVTDKSSDEEKKAFISTQQMIALHHHQLVKLKQAAARLNQCDPATQLLFSIVEAGKWQDKGTAIEAFFTIDVPYPLLCAQYAEMKIDLARIEAEKNRAIGAAAEEADRRAAEHQATALASVAAVLGQPQFAFTPDQAAAPPVETLTLQRLM